MIEKLLTGVKSINLNKQIMSECTNRFSPLLHEYGTSILFQDVALVSALFLPFTTIQLVLLSHLLNVL